MKLWRAVRLKETVSLMPAFACTVRLFPSKISVADEKRAIVHH
jgi:hypothetical protein